MTSIPTSGARSGLPTARGFLPAGTSGHVCIGYNRACKAVRIAIAALAAGRDDALTDGQMDALAAQAGVNVPGGEETRAAVRAALAPPVTGDDTDQDVRVSVVDAAQAGLPFRYRLRDGRTVLMVPIPIPPAGDAPAGDR